MNVLNKAALFFLLLFVIGKSGFGQILHVGLGQTYEELEQASLDAQPGDTILVHAGIYTARQNISNLSGSADEWIYIISKDRGGAEFIGGTEAWHLSDVSYLVIDGFAFRQQTGNGVNIDDGGSYDTPSHHIAIRGCEFTDMQSSGNNDLLKLSGLDSFAIVNCLFQNGADGGSGIDMVGCHNGWIEDGHFENMGSNCIQAKGGTQFITIRRNKFVDGGNRSLNLGGSTGLAFFRPDSATFEAADLYVHSNIFIRSWAPVAYVGCVRVDVVNNTIVDPGNWVIRILQETVDPDRFLTCGDNRFMNNLIYINDGLSRDVNIGPNTRPESFLFSHNFWFNYENMDWSGPELPVIDTFEMIGLDPMFVDTSIGNYTPGPGSPAIGVGGAVSEPILDFSSKKFAFPRSIGALEAEEFTSIGEWEKTDEMNVYPNPANRTVTISNLENGQVWLLTADGKAILLMKREDAFQIPENVLSGVYWLMPPSPARIVPVVISDRK